MYLILLRSLTGKNKQTNKKHTLYFIVSLPFLTTSGIKRVGEICGYASIAIETEMRSCAKCDVRLLQLNVKAVCFNTGVYKTSDMKLKIYKKLNNM